MKDNKPSEAENNMADLKEEIIETSVGKITIKQLSFKRSLWLMDQKEGWESFYHAYIPNEEDWLKLENMNEEDGKKISAGIAKVKAEVRDPNQQTSKEL